MNDHKIKRDYILSIGIYKHLHSILYKKMKGNIEYILRENKIKKILEENSLYEQRI
jgi:hypothetical protein